MKELFRRKSMKVSEAAMDEGSDGLRRHLNAVHLITIGIGAIIGAGIFVVTGQAAALYAGPAIVISFLIAALICTLTGLCYAELASFIPVAGGSYSYAYAALGELPAWIVGWCVIGQYFITASTVAVGWSGYLVSFCKDLGLELSSLFIRAPIAYSAAEGWHWSGSLFNLPAAALVFLLGILIATGIRAATHFNNVMVVVKLCTVVLFIVFGIPYIQKDNWIPFIPENTGVFGEFGWSGILRGAGLAFFAYIGFDTIATLSQDAVNPQKNVPRGILGSLFLCTVAYIIIALILTGVVHYSALNVPDPMAAALHAMGSKFFWLKSLVKVAILAGLMTVVLVQMLGQTRVFMAIGKDGLLPQIFSHLHHRTKTPLFGTCVATLGCMAVSALFSIEMLAQFVSMITLFIFAIVCLGVWVLRYTHPEFHRSFKVPFMPAIPLLGIVACLGQMCMLPLLTWVQMGGWLLIGSACYFCYGFKHSRLDTK